MCSKCIHVVFIKSSAFALDCCRHWGGVLSGATILWFHLCQCPTLGKYVKVELYFLEKRSEYATFHHVFASLALLVCRAKPGQPCFIFFFGFIWLSIMHFPFIHNPSVPSVFSVSSLVFKKEAGRRSRLCATVYCLFICFATSEAAWSKKANVHLFQAVGASDEEIPKSLVFWYLELDLYIVGAGLMSGWLMSTSIICCSQREVFCKTQHWQAVCDVTM